MKVKRAIKELEALKNEAVAPGFADSDAAVDTWDGKVRAVLTAVFDEQNHFVTEHDAIKYVPNWTVAGDRAAFHKAKKRGVDECCSNIEAAIYQLSFRCDSETQVPVAADYDPDLWADVSALAESGD